MIGARGVWLALLLAIGGCGSDDSTEKRAPKLAEGPGQFSADYATSPNFFTQMTAPRKGLTASPHGFVQIFYSKNIQPVITKTSFSVPPGTVAIKAQDMDGNGTLDNVLNMVKQAPGFDPDNGDWLYERRQADGTLIDSGKTAFCIDCHTNWSPTDYLAGTTVRD